MNRLGATYRLVEVIDSGECFTHHGDVWVPYSVHNASCSTSPPPPPLCGLSPLPLDILPMRLQVKGRLHPRRGDLLVLENPHYCMKWRWYCTRTKRPHRGGWQRSLGRSSSSIERGSKRRDCFLPETFTWSTNGFVLLSWVESFLRGGDTEAIRLAEMWGLFTIVLCVCVCVCVCGRVLTMYAYSTGGNACSFFLYSIQRARRTADWGISEVWKSILGPKPA